MTPVFCDVLDGGRGKGKGKWSSCIPVALASCCLVTPRVAMLRPNLISDTTRRRGLGLEEVGGSRGKKTALPTILCMVS